MAIISNEVTKWRKIPNINKLNDALSKMGASDRYEIIVEICEKGKYDNLYRIVEAAKLHNVPAYQLYQDLYMEADKAHTHDNLYAKMLDVDRACTKVYTILLNMIAKMNQELVSLSSKVDTLIESTETASAKEDKYDNKPPV